MRVLSDREVKQRLLDMMVWFDAFCAEHGLRYSIACGTLLGAMRHGGFIPWDDDIDVAMPREDYERMLALTHPESANDKTAAAEVHGQYEVLHYRYTKGYYYSFAKIIDTETYLEESYRVEKCLGVFIDIFPHDYFKDEASFKATFPQRMKEQNVLFRNGFRINKETSPDLPRRLFRYARRLAVLPTRMKTMARIEEKYIAPDGKREAAALCGYAFSRWKGDLFPKEIWNAFIRIPFEDIEVCCFADWETYLNGEFRDWKAVPPAEKQVKDHQFTVYLK